MVTLFQLYRRAFGLTREEFQAHWFHHHARHGRDHPAVRWYTQLHTLIADPIRDAVNLHTDAQPLESYDGIAMMCFDDKASAHHALADDRFAAAREEEPVFVDRTRSTMILTTEYVVIPPCGAAPIVATECATSRRDIDWHTFNATWLEHGKSALKDADLMAGYLQCHLASDVPHDPGIPGLPDGADRWDGFAVAYFDSVASMKAVGKRVSETTAMRDDVARFIDPARCVGSLSHRRVIKALVR